MKIFAYDDDKDILFLLTFIFKDWDVTIYNGAPENLEDISLDEDVVCLMDYMVDGSAIIDELLVFAKNHPNNTKIVYSGYSKQYMDKQILDKYMYVNKSKFGELRSLISGIQR